MFEKMKFKAVSMSLLTLGTVACFTACSGNDKAQQQQQQANVAQVATYTVKVGDLNVDDSYPATIKGKTDIEVRPMISGTITKVCVDEGQHVNKGQVLFLIDEVTLQAAVRSAEAGVVSARAGIAAAQSSVATAQLTANNQKKLLDKGIISNYQYETATLQLRAAQEQLNQARSALSQAQAGVTQAKKNLSYSRVTAPSAGVVGTIPNREGSLASPSGAALTTISDNSSVYAYFSLNEKQIIELTKGGKISLNAAIGQMPSVKLRLSDGSTYAHAGHVSTVAGVLNQTTGTASVRALFPNQNGMLRSGASGEVLIPAKTDNVLIIPQKCTYEVQDQKYVYLIGADHKAIATPIKVLKQNDGQNYVVTQGLKQGDVIALEGVGTKVKEGTQILTAQEATQMAAAAAKEQAKK